MKRCKFHKKAVRAEYEVSDGKVDKGWVVCDYCNRRVRGFKVQVSACRTMAVVLYTVKQ